MNYGFKKGPAYIVNMRNKMNYVALLFLQYLVKKGKLLAILRLHNLELTQRKKHSWSWSLVLKKMTLSNHTSVIANLFAAVKV